MSRLRDARDWRGCVKSLDSTQLFPGVAELLTALEARELKWAVVTNVVSFYAHAALSHFGLRAPTLVAYHDVKRCKPHPEGCLKAAELLGFAPAEVLGVGDLETDREAYVGAGMAAVCAGWNPAAESGGPWDGLLRSPADLMKCLK